MTIITAASVTAESKPQIPEAVAAPAGPSRVAAAPGASPIERELQSCTPVATFTDGTSRKCFTALAGQTLPAGNVCAEIMNNQGAAGDVVRITYDTSGTNYCLTEVQAYFGDTIPATGSGNPQPGQFPVKNTTMPAGCVKTATLTTPLNPRCCSSSASTIWMNRGFKLAAHSSVVLSTGGGGQTAWSTGVDITGGGSWATYTPVVLNCQCPGAPVAAPVKSPTKVCLSFCCLDNPVRSLDLPSCYALSFSGTDQGSHESADKETYGCSCQGADEEADKVADQEPYEIADEEADGCSSQGSYGCTC